jgi:hypothetical protein
MRRYREQKPEKCFASIVSVASGCHPAVPLLTSVRRLGSTMDIE